MNCQDFLKEVEESAPGHELGRAALEHERECAMCRAFRSESDALKRLMTGMAEVCAPADFDFRLRARLAGEREARRSFLGQLVFAPGRPALIYAASFVLLIALAVAVQQLRSSRPHEARTTTSARMYTERAVPSNDSRETESTAINVGPSTLNEDARNLYTGSKAVESSSPFGPRRIVLERRKGSAHNASARAINPAQNFAEISAPYVSLDPELRVQLGTPLSPSRLLVNERDGTTRTVLSESSAARSAAISTIIW